MKPQFSAQSLLLLIALMGVWMGALLGEDRLIRLLEPDSPSTVGSLSTLAVVTSPVWLPCVFLAYAAGRRRLTIWALAVLVVAEALAFFGVVLVWHFSR